MEDLQSERLCYFFNEMEESEDNENDTQINKKEEEVVYEIFCGDFFFDHSSNEINEQNGENHVGWDDLAENGDEDGDGKMFFEIVGR